MMVDTTRLGMTLVEDTDTIGGSDPNTSMKAKVNDALTTIDNSAGDIVCTSLTRPTTGLFPGIRGFETDTMRRIVNVSGTATGWRPDPTAIGKGKIRVVRPPRPYGQDTLHSSAPSVVFSKKTGELIVVYRQATDHFVSQDGIIRLTRSADLGMTWSAPTTILTLMPSFGLQGAGISESRDGTKLWLVYFKATTSLSAAGVFFRTSTDSGVTWSTETRIDSALPFAATTDVIHELSDGTLVHTYYGRSGAETWDSTWIAKSTNGGTTWNSTRLMNGATAANHFQEPVLAMKGSLGVIAYRHGTNASIGTQVTVDNTANFTAGLAKFAGTGKPHIFWANSNKVACIYRQISSGHAMIRYSENNGVAWNPDILMDTSVRFNGWMLYSASALVAPGVNFICHAMEFGSAGDSPGTSRVYFSYAAEAGGETPYGTVPTEAQAEAELSDDILFATSFDQPDGVAASPWAGVIMNGGGTTINVTNGELHPNALNQFTIARVHLKNVADLTIQTEMYTTTGSGSAGGIVFRMVDSGSFMLMVAEDSNVRLYKYISGVATVLETAPNTHQYNSWNKFKVVTTGTLVFGFYNEWPLIRHVMSGGDHTVFRFGYFHGVKLLPTAGSLNNHRIRNWRASWSNRINT